MEQLSSFPDDATREEERESQAAAAAEGGLRGGGRGGGGGHATREGQCGALGARAQGSPPPTSLSGGKRVGIAEGAYRGVISHMYRVRTTTAYAESRGEKPCVPKPCGVKFSFYCLSVLLFKLLLGGGNEKTSRNIDISFAKCIERQMHDVVTETSSDFVGRP